MPTTALAARRMLMEPSTDTTFWGSTAAAATALAVAIWRAVGKSRRDDKVDETEVETLRALDAAVAHWRELYNDAWAQVLRERTLRERAEQRASDAFNEIEKLRGEVAALRREVEKLVAASA